VRAVRLRADLAPVEGTVAGGPLIFVASGLACAAFTVTVLISVVAHGVTAAPFTRRLAAPADERA
jgi:NhaP-type Na+/H+ or K+/H+ antiporter